ncbi:N-acetylmuramic acid 6-phosphate etherase [Thalassobacillus sp. CUG 92003]|uniref:N-acetylmuramic acid 6-phosphate etherase n=1 Tax=Thalassobacillus sp. CUG 92003 TaxID=2736641 RepID=UPI0015E6800E|nr:N-acetylmuramic acid 6-phosphate etherase [Thalassobacillus sp. CUG 92003]
MENLYELPTEMQNKHSLNMDKLPTREILTIINNEDQTVATCVQEALPEIEQAVDLIFESISQGGRLFYVGAGTSGRLGVLDAVECPPTFSTPPELVQGIIAGGETAIFKAVEGAEDNEDLGADDLIDRGISKQDVVVGVAASGRTPYVKGALAYARKIGARTISLSSNQEAKISKDAQVCIYVNTGPEILTGSTRMKAATAHKLVLNMLTTTIMVKSGKVYENLMVDLHASNEKLRKRAISMVSNITEVSAEEAESVLERTNYEVKPAIVMIKAGLDAHKAQEYLREAKGFIRQAVEMALASQTPNDIKL